MLLEKIPISSNRELVYPRHHTGNLGGGGGGGAVVLGIFSGGV